MLVLKWEWVFFWSQIPLLRVAIPLIVGIVLHRYYPYLLSWRTFLFLTAFLLACFLFFHWSKKLQHYSLRWVAGLIVSLLFVNLGYGIRYMHVKDKGADKVCIGKQVVWIAELVESPSRTRKSVKSLAKLRYMEQSDSLCEMLGEKFLIYIKQDSVSLQLEVGDLLMARSYFQKVPAAKNPAQFDYSAFLANRNVFMQTYLSKNWKRIGERNSLQKFATNWRQQFLATYQKAGIVGDNYAVLAALTLGYKNDLNPNLREKYSASGAMHILAVSGLHIGIVYLIFQWLAQFLGNKNYMKLLRSLLLLLALWSYALLTGLSPSVQRAACMFSFIVLADATGRHNNIFNSIAASAIFLLLLQPNLLFEVGFQLSYAAIIGIILIHPKIYPLLQFKHAFLDKIWSLMVVSLAAQLGTFVFSIYYFHQFPSFFLLTNLLVIPLAFLILLVAIGLLILYLLFNTTFVLGQLLDLLLSLLNFFVDFFYTLPFSHLDGIYISALSAMLLFLAVVFLLFYLYYYKGFYLLLFLGLILLLSIFKLVESRKQDEQQLITLYSSGKKFSLSVIKGKQAVLIADFPPTDRSAAIAMEHLKSLAVKRQDWLRLDSTLFWESPLLCFQRRQNAVYLKADDKELIFPLRNFHSAKAYTFDYVLMSNRLDKAPCELGTVVLPKALFSYYQYRRILNESKGCEFGLISADSSISL